MKDSKKSINLSIENSPNSPKFKKRNEVTIFTILSAIERDINELIQQSQIRSHKTKLFSINETIKTTLLKKLSNYNELVSDHEDFLKLKTEYGSLKEISQKDLERLKKENEHLKKYVHNINNNSATGANNINVSTNSDIINMLSEKDSKKDEIIKKYLTRIDNMNYQLNEEKAKTAKYVLHIKHIEECYKTLTNEYNYLLSKSEKKENNDQSEKQINELKKINNDYKSKYEEVVKINNDLKSKLIESESNYTMHSDEFKSLIKRNSVLSKKIEENEKEKEKHSAEIAYKEERLQALRQMNTKLEQKSNQILKKWETFKLFEEKSNQVSNNCNTLLEVIEDLNKKLSSTIEENTGLQKAVDNLNQENYNYIKKNEELTEELKMLQGEKEEIYQKNFEMELSLKKYTESQKFDKEIIKDTKDKKMPISVNIINNKLGKEKNSGNLFSNTLTNNEILKFDELRPAKIIIKENNTIEIKNQ